MSSYSTFEKWTQNYPKQFTPNYKTEHISHTTKIFLWLHFQFGIIDSTSVGSLSHYQLQYTIIEKDKKTSANEKSIHVCACAIDTAVSRVHRALASLFFFCLFVCVLC